MDDERAETYVRLRAEVELRRVGDQLHGLDAVAGTGDRPAPGVPFALAETALWKVTHRDPDRGRMAKRGRGVDVFRIRDRLIAHADRGLTAADPDPELFCRPPPNEHLNEALTCGDGRLWGHESIGWLDGPHRSRKYRMIFSACS